MINYIEDWLKAHLPDDFPPVRLSAAATEDDKWDDEGGADVCVRVEHPWMWYVLGNIRGPYYYLRDHGAVVLEVAFHVSEPDMLTDGEHLGYQRYGDVVYYRGDSVDSIIHDVAIDVEDLARNTLKKLERERHGDEAS
uniref:Uncharacterized protein n=1 Tax=Siphoviridae sp. ctZF426 TaxID=2827580 RepID=A0A8S5RT81_9CAUD|nr:MAG TPA: hypothetical protein [Siphoviridae sp. ctZF426]